MEQGLGAATTPCGDGDWKYTVAGSGSRYSFDAFKQYGGLSANIQGHGEITKFGFNLLTVIHQGRVQQVSYKVDTDGTLDGDSPSNEGLDAKTEIKSTTSSAKAAHGAVVAVNAPKFAISFSTTSFLWALSARLPSALNTAGANLADRLQGQLGSYVKVDLMPPTSGALFKLRRAAYVMWVSSVAYAGAGLLAMLPCQQYYQTYLVQAGIDKDLLGQTSGLKPPDNGVTILKKAKTTVIPAIKGCEPKPN